MNCEIAEKGRVSFGLVEHHRLLREVIRDSILDGGRHTCLFHCSRIAGLCGWLANGMSPNLLLCEIDSPHELAWPSILDARLQFPQMPIIAVSSKVNDYMVYKFTRLRLSGWIDDTDCAFRDWLEIIQLIASGRSYYSLSVADAFSRRRDVSTHWGRLLSEREIDLMVSFGNGNEDEEVAQAHGIALSTASTHRKNIMRKIGVHSSRELVRWARRYGFPLLDEIKPEPAM